MSRNLHLKVQNTKRCLKLIDLAMVKQDDDKNINEGLLENTAEVVKHASC